MHQRRASAGRLALLLAMTVLLPAGVASAKAAGPVTEGRLVGSSEAQPAPSNWGHGTPAIPWGRLVYGTLAVIALICAGVYVLKKLNGGAPLAKGRYLEVLEARPVGRNVQLILVKVAGRIVLLAFGGDSVTAVAEFSDEEVGEFAPPKAGLEGFKSLLKRLTGAPR